MITEEQHAIRRRERRAQTRTALLDAAERLWAERGIRGASLDDIANTAGLTKGAVYSNFTGKTDLLLALLERCTRTDLGLEMCAREDEARLPVLLLIQLCIEEMQVCSAVWLIAD